MPGGAHVRPSIRLFLAVLRRIDWLARVGPDPFKTTAGSAASVHSHTHTQAHTPTHSPADVGRFFFLILHFRELQGIQLGVEKTHESGRSHPAFLMLFVGSVFNVRMCVCLSVWLSLCRYAALIMFNYTESVCLFSFRWPFTSSPPLPPPPSLLSSLFPSK